MAKSELSPTMQAAKDHAIKHGGAMVRQPGGFWVGANDAQRFIEGGHQTPWFGTSTMQALVLRGHATYTAHHEGRSGKFPIRLEIVTGSAA